MRHALLLPLVLAACASERALAVDTSELTLPRGAGADITVSSAGAPLARLDGFALHSDDPAIARIELAADGRRVRVVGLQEGDTQVRIAFGDRELAIPAHVTPPAIVAFAIEPGDVAAPVGARLPLRATVTDSLGARHDVTDAATWEIEDPRIARIDGAGLHGMAAGSTTLYALLDGRAAEVAVAVLPR